VPGETTREEILLRAGLTLASELSLPDVLQKIVDLSTEVAGAKYGALGVLTRAGTEIHDFLTHGISKEERARIGALPRGKGLLGALIRDASPLRLERIQSDPRSVGFPANHPPMTSFLGVPIAIRGRVFGNLYLTEKQGASAFTEEDQRAVETLAAQAAVAIENARLYDENFRARRNLQAMKDVADLILQGGDLESVLFLIATSARDLVGGEAATLALATQQPGRLVLRVAVGLHAEEFVGLEFSATDSLAGDVMTTGKGMVIDDASRDPRMNQPIVRTGDFGPTIVTPLIVRGRAFGALSVARVEGGVAFFDEDEALVSRFADQAAIAIEYFRVQEELQRLMLIDERERIAKDLHDDIIQSLFAEGMALQAAEAMVNDPDAMKQRLSLAVDHIDRVIRDLRNYIFGLRPGVMADRQLERTLRDLVENFSEGNEDIRFEVRTDPEAVSLLAGRATDVTHAAREAVSNAVRHSGGSEIVIVLEKAGDDIAVLSISDNGKGFDLEEAAGRGHGLANLRARAESMGGSLHIGGAEGGGTHVVVTIPV